MKRHLLIIAICLLLGAAVNVAVAWGCALWLRPNSSTVEKARNVDEQRVWFVARWARAPTELWFSRRSVTQDTGSTGQDGLHPQDLLPSWSPLREPLETFRIGSTPVEERLVLAHGWPRPALWVELRRDPVSAFPRLEAVGGIRTPWNWSGGSLEPVVLPKTLPWRPVWSGLLINTVLFAAIMWLIGRALIGGRHLIRRRRGLCPKCAYPMGESSICPECGRPRPRRQAAAHGAGGGDSSMRV